MLEVRDLHANNGKSRILEGTDFCVGQGEIANRGIGSVPENRDIF